jgi:hypothetical protein
MQSYEYDIEKLKRAVRSSHAVMFNLNTVDVDLDDEYVPVVRKREPEKPPVKNESPQKP